MITKWTEKEDKLLIKLRKKNVPYKKLPEFFKNRSQDACRNRAWVLQSQASNNWLEDEIIGVIDIEASSLKANTGWMISFWIKRSDGVELGSCIKRSEVLSGKLDKRIMQDLLKALQEIDVLVTYYGTGFDIPFLRARAEILGLDFPSFGTVKHFDLYYLIRNKFALTRKSLGVACEALGLGTKGHEPIEVWNKARIGHQASLNKLFKYNKQDTRITYDLFERVKKYRKITRKSI